MDNELIKSLDRHRRELRKIKEWAEAWDRYFDSLLKTKDIPEFEIRKKEIPILKLNEEEKEEYYKDPKFQKGDEEPEEDEKKVWSFKGKVIIIALIALIIVIYLAVRTLLIELGFEPTSELLRFIFLLNSTVGG